MYLNPPSGATVRGYVNQLNIYVHVKMQNAEYRVLNDHK